MKIPILIDVPFRLVRKHLPIPFYIFLRNLVGRGKQYYTMEHYWNIIERYRENINMDGRVLLEIGPGNDISTGVFLVLLGARHVYLVDKITDNPHIDRAAGDRIDHVNHIMNYIKKNIPDQSIELHRDPADVLKRITQVDCYFTETKRLFENIQMGPSIDSIVSHNVLEHVTDLEALFRIAYGLLNENGIMYHHVDISDHLYHFLDRMDNRLLMQNVLNHMRYSNRVWNLINDSDSVYMNRRILPYYLDLCKKYHFEIIKLERNVLQPGGMDQFKIHPDIYIGISPGNMEQEISSFSLTVKKVVQ